MNLQSVKVCNTRIGSKKIQLNIQKEGAPLVLAIAFEQMDEALLRECSRKQCRLFNLLTISDLRWDEELSPWAHKPVVMRDDHFTGEAPAFLSQILEQILPWALSELEMKPERIFIAGYSMGGLFSLYSLYNCSRFNGCACVSGSLWYPGFLDYALSHSFKEKPEAVYLSLGDKETRAANTYLQKTGAIMQELEKKYVSEEIDCIFEWNSGNHFVDALYRLAKGIRWILRQPDSDEG